jgi:DNA-directed RNA polymerase specialized sigma24 family protein
VAITRTRNSVHIPETLLPKDFPRSQQIHKMRVDSDADKNKNDYRAMLNQDDSIINKKAKAYSLDEVRNKHHDAYKPWTIELDDELTIMFCEGLNVKDMAKHFGRSKGAIHSRIRRLELEELYG